MNVRIAKIANIPVYLADNYLIFAVLMILFKLFFSGAAVALNTGLAIVALSLIVVMHEYGHALTARAFGAKTDSITLYFFGGLARINEYSWQKLIDKPRHSLLVWLAGPMTNIVFAGLLFLLFHPFGHTSPLVGHPLLIKYAAFLFSVNVGLAVFNLLPVFPMDGGGILFSFLHFFMSKAKAIRITSVVGIIGSLVFIAGAIYLKAIMLGVVGLMALMACIQAPKSKFYA